MDTRGLESLSFLRSVHPRTESVMMDPETFTRFKHFSTGAAAFASRKELKLSASERELFDILKAGGKLLEQERIPHAYALEQLHRRLK